MTNHPTKKNFDGHISFETIFGNLTHHSIFTSRPSSFVL
ncbi:unnamed protein product, partial [Larinioides sclopetarius]